MIKKLLLGLVVLVLVGIAWFHAVGKGWFGDLVESSQVVAGPRPDDPALSPVVDETPQVLFGDLHTHTNHSLDAALFNTRLVKGGGVVTPADACDFARYCAALDFWSINDHAESLTPRSWADSVSAIRKCNAQAGDSASPDMVSFVGWEWSNRNPDDVPSHFGHKNVVFRSWGEGQVPTRPISSMEQSVFTRAPAALVGLVSLADTVKAASRLGRYTQESKSVPPCPEGIPANELPDDCREVALTPRDLYRKLDEWGFDALVIPHGLAWGTTNPLTGDFVTQMDVHDQRYQKLLESYSGHGNSELFEDFQRIAVDERGEAYCPEGTENFTPCCQQVGVIARSRCDDPDSPACEASVEAAISAFVAKGAPKGRRIFPDASLDDWAGCGQLQNAFQPASMYVPRLSTQYNLALGFDKSGAPQRVKFGLIGSSDSHQARPGSSYKENNRLLYTDHKEVGKEPLFSEKVDIESGAFYYTGGLVAAHTRGRHRDAIWEALSSRNVYATSGDRILVWFDLINGPAGELPMGSEVYMSENPRFRVRALGAFEQQPGCPDYALAALGRERLRYLCGGECYRPGDRRKAITRVEIVRIRPQFSPDEEIRPLIENEWKVFQCPADGTGCTVEFEDAEYIDSGRPVLYYARVIQEAEPLTGGDPFGCEYDDKGNCVRRNYCIGKRASPDNDCLAEAEPRAWTSPIFIERPGPP